MLQNTTANNRTYNKAPAFESEGQELSYKSDLIETSEPTTNAEGQPNLELLLSVVKSDTSLAKRRALDNNGLIISQKTGTLKRGTVENITLHSMQALADLIHKADFKTAIIAGTHKHSLNPVTVQARSIHEANGKPADVITRTKDNFEFKAGAGGLLIIDCDERITKTDFLNAVGSIVPLDKTAYVYSTSSSSHLFKTDPDTGHRVQVQGLKGQRLYIAVKDASDITRACDVLWCHLWLNGHGIIQVSKSGQLLERTTIADRAMWQPERFDFVGGSDCVAPLEHRPPAPDAHEGEALDTLEALAPLTDAQTADYKALVRKAKAEAEPEANAQREAFAEETALKNLAHEGTSEPTAEQLQQAIANVKQAQHTNILTGDYVITLDDGEQVTVGHMLDNPSHYHGKTCKDPLEPDYDGHRTTGKIYLFSNTPNIHSMAHGGQTFRLIRQPHNIEHARGYTANTTNSTLELLKHLPDYFDLGDNLVSVKNGQVVPLKNDLLSYELGTIAQYYEQKQNSKGETYKRPIDPPRDVINQMLARGKNRNLKPLNAVITAPTITADGHEVINMGYDRKTGLYVAPVADLKPLPVFVSDADAVRAYRELMKPFDTFDFASDLSRSVMLSAVLTAVIRPAVPLAPAVAFDAPMQGSGKTYAVQCVSTLASGKQASTYPQLRSEDEERKVITSELINGSQHIVFDNIVGQYDSATVAQFLTSANYKGRILGKSEVVDVPNRAMLWLTSNNLTLRGDMPRRVLVARIDTGLENPTKAKRDLSAIGGMKPDQYIMKHRLELTNHALTLIKGYLQSEYAYNGVTEDKLVSFEEWDRLARQPVAWLANVLKVAGLEDPKKAIDANIQSDPEQEALAEMLLYLNEWSQGHAFKAKDAFDRATWNEELMSIVQELGRNPKPNSRTLGMLFGKVIGRYAGGLKLEYFSQHPKHGSTYIIVKKS